MSLVDIKVPDIGGHANVDVIELCVQVGQTVTKDDSLFTLETDKATMDVPAEQAGVVAEWFIKVGSKISEGDVVGRMQLANRVATPSEVSTHNTAALINEVETSLTATLPINSDRLNMLVPDIGGHDNVDVIEVPVKVGDVINVDETLITLETDKATMDVPATAAGRVVEVLVTVGSKVSQGDVIVVIESRSSNMNAMPVVSAASTIAKTPVQVSMPLTAPLVVQTTIDEVAFAQTHAGPAARKLARELGVDLSKVQGSGRKGRITETDIKGFVKITMQTSVPSSSAVGSGSGLDLLPWPKVDFAKFGPVTRLTRTKIQKISGANLHRNWVIIPHVTFNDEADITDMDAFRITLNKEWEKAGIKVSPLAFMIKAAAETLKAFPTFNSSLDGDDLVLKSYYHIGFAADTPNGLVVPVIKDVDKKGLKEICVELSALSALAREGKLKPTDMQGATFTLSSLGGIGGTSFTPIINAPEVAILGICKGNMKPVWNGKEFSPRLMCPLSLSFDHRVIDGAAAARFTVHFGKLLSDVRRLIL
ncbi:MAG: dihydrolipoyllysine-residue acetyltransferase [Neisseriaceae bacterium]|nr:dihydrolipoyllysine-residue acetyltransferase [Neisseriaceae bacterium]